MHGSSTVDVNNPIEQFIISGPPANTCIRCCSS
jgi:hypothetical protein